MKRLVLAVLVLSFCSSFVDNKYNPVLILRKPNELDMDLQIWTLSGGTTETFSQRESNFPKVFMSQILEYVADIRERLQSLNRFNIVYETGPIKRPTSFCASLLLALSLLLLVIRGLP
jgi:hypothetical protein